VGTNENILARIWDSRNSNIAGGSAKVYVLERNLEICSKVDAHILWPRNYIPMVYILGKNFHMCTR
jgi:hypothetical protein